MARRRARKSQKGKMPAGLAAYWSKRRHKKNPANSPRRQKRRSSVLRNEPRRRRSYRRNEPRRRYRRNPDGFPTTGFLMDAAYVTGGFFVTRMTAGFVVPMIPGADTMPSVRILGKGAVAWGLGWLGGNFLGRRSGQLIMLGGLVEALSDAVRTYVSPFVPALADGGMESYPALPMSSYPALSGGYSDETAVGATQYDEAL